MDEFFEKNKEEDTLEESKDEPASKKKKKAPPPRIGVHCVAGLGRAPLLVAIALVNKGCEPFEAIDLIRKNRKGALNIIQANFIVEYRPEKKGSSGGGGCLTF